MKREASQKMNSLANNNKDYDMEVMSEAGSDGQVSGTHLSGRLEPVTCRVLPSNVKTPSLTLMKSYQGESKLKKSDSAVPILISAIIGGIVALFVFIACLVVALHRVHEGCVGVYFKNG